MYELVKIGENTYYIDCPSKIGIYKSGDSVYLIDSGEDKDIGRKIYDILQHNKWDLAGIINTHSNIDHVAGNKYLQDRTGCDIISTRIENVFIEKPMLEFSFAYGGYPISSLISKVIPTEISKPTKSIDMGLPRGLEAIRLPGHHFDMIGIRTSDNVFFVADSLVSEEMLSKYHIIFIYDVKAFLETLDMLERVEARMIIPSHAEAVSDIGPLVRANRNKVIDIIEFILKICKKNQTFEDVLKGVMDNYNRHLNFIQYCLVGSTVKSYLTYLYDQEKLDCVFKENKMYWVVK
ncbi:MAG TPA: MBL fold metallo-hydrolase [Clostridiales bacterium]|nr:MAG: MBL fold metallo-hydrolase [Clostridiales bacterium GWD2_32_59]HAN10702.1 MBL fold metallo-hydrolase [Clostridiales bacterium]